MKTIMQVKTKRDPYSSNTKKKTHKSEYIFLYLYISPIIYIYILLF